MTHNSLSICALAMTVFLSACGGGGGGGGGGGTATIDTPVSITGANFARVASLAVRSNLIVADSPNFNEGYPAAIVGNAPPPSINLMNLSRMQLVEINKVTPSQMVSPELPIGVRPITDAGQTSCGPLGGTKTKTYTDSDGDLDTRVFGDKLVIVYTDCKLELTREANNCVQISETDKVVTLNGTVETLITAATSATVFTSQLTYTNLNFATARGAATINGKLLISLAAASPQITLTTVDSSPLTTTGGGVTERLRGATIKYDDNQQGCDVNLASNNNYSIKSSTTGEVASSDLGFVNMTVTSDLVGDSDSPAPDSGFPVSGRIDIVGGSGTNMTIVAAGSGTAVVAYNRLPDCKLRWIDIFNNTLPSTCL